MRVLLVDDDILPMKDLKGLIQEHCPQITEVETCSSPVRALRLLQSSKWDLMFLDIEMPEMTGFELLDVLAENRTPQVIFLTAFNQYAIDAFRVNAVDYLLKPIELKELLVAVDKAEQRQDLDRPKEQLFIQKLVPLFDGDDYRFFPPDNIIRVLGEGSYTRIFSTTEKPFLVSQYLGKLESLFLKRGFIRCHRSHLINPRHITKYSRKDGGFFVMSNDDVVPISASRKEHLKEMLDLLQ